MVVRKIAAGVALTVASLASAAPAFAQAYPGGTSTERSPGAVLGTTEDRSTGAQVKGVQVTRGETLPLTGSDVVPLTLLGLGLVAGGTVLVKRSRRQPLTASA